MLLYSDSQCRAYRCRPLGDGGRLLVLVFVEDLQNDDPHRQNGGYCKTNSNLFAAFGRFAIFDRPWKKKLNS